MEKKKNKLLVIDLFKFGTLATLRGRLPTKDDVKKKRRRRKKKEKKCRKRNIKQRTLIL